MVPANERRLPTMWTSKPFHHFNPTRITALRFQLRNLEAQADVANLAGDVMKADILSGVIDVIREELMDLGYNPTRAEDEALLQGGQS